jgi:hypothetical protein
MPTIPQTSQLNSLDVLSPSVAVPGGTAQAEAISRLGGIVAQDSFAILDKVKEAEAIDASSQAFYKDRFASEDQLTQLKLKYPTGYITDDSGSKVQNKDGSYRTITQEYRDWANEQFQKSQDTMPTEAAKGMYKNIAGKYYNDSLISVRGDELKARVTSFSENQDTQVQLSKNRLVDAPRVDQAYEALDSAAMQYKAQTGVLIDAHQAHAGMVKTQAEIPEGLFHGFYNQALADPKGGPSREDKIDYAISVLHGQDPQSLDRKGKGLPTISDTMNADQKARVEAELIRLRGVARELDKSGWDRKITTAGNQLDIEARYPGDAAKRRPIYLAPLYREGVQLLQSGKIDEFEFVQKVGELVAKDASSTIFSSPSFLMASPEDKQKFIDRAVQLAQANFSRVDPALVKKYPYIDATFNKEVARQMQAISDQKDGEAHADFASFANFHPDVKRLTNTLEQSQTFFNPQVLAKTGAAFKQRNDMLESLGDSYFGMKSPDFRYLSKSESQQWGQFIKSDLNNHSQVADALFSLRKADPQRYGSIIDQMIKDKNLTPEWRLALALKDRGLTADLVKTIKDGDKIRAQASGIMEANGVTPQMMKNSVMKLASPYLASMTVMNGDSSLAENERQIMGEVIATKAMDMYRSENGAVSNTDHYAQEAVDAIFSNKYHLISGGGNSVKNLFGLDAGGPTYFMIPKQIGDRVLTSPELAQAEKNRTAFLEPGNLKVLGVVPPKGLDKTGIDPEKFYEQVQKSGRLSNKGDMTTFTVLWRNPQSGRFEMVMTAKKDRYGRPVPLTLPIDRIVKPLPAPSATPKAPVNVPPDNRGWLDKIKDAMIDMKVGQ